MAEVRAHAAHEHVVAPHQEAEAADGQHGVDHGPVAENRLARRSRGPCEVTPMPGQDGDVDLGVAEEPEQVLPQQRRAALCV